MQETKQEPMKTGRPRPRRRPANKEHVEQCLLVEWLAYRRIGVFAVPNGASLGSRHGVKKEHRAKSAAIQMNRLKREGLELGAPDLVLHVRCKCGTHFARPIVIEMKALGVTKCSPDQLAVHADLEREGWHVIVGSGFDDARRKIEALGL